MILWRISKYVSLDGRGGLLTSERWHSRGRPWSGAEGPKKNSVEELKRIYASDFAIKQALASTRPVIPGSTASAKLPETQSLDAR